MTVITSEPIQGDRSIDAMGYVVSPGFIDQHRRGVTAIAYKLALRDGVTTAMDLEFDPITQSFYTRDVYERRVVEDPTRPLRPAHCV
ncbi:MAG: cytosine/adenosine deaminase-related metal-dependent hydrolase [Congregibacter sp.]